MRINKETQAPVIEVKMVICNSCGNELKKKDCGIFDEHISIEKKWGYGSEFDGETHSFDICESCYIKIIENFKKYPEIQ